MKKVTWFLDSIKSFTSGHQFPAGETDGWRMMEIITLSF